MKAWFIRFRGGNNFLYLMTGFLAVWFIIRLVYPLDNEVLNLILSIEASVTTCLLLDLQLSAAIHDREQMAKILKIEEQIEDEIEELEDAVGGAGPAMSPCPDCNTWHYGPCDGK